MIESSDLPKTSQINSYRFEECFEKLTANGDEVLAIILSSKLSGTFNSAKQAAKKFGEKVKVVDSLNACIGERILCEYALRLIEKGLSLEDIVKELETKRENICVLALLDTLKYLKKGGRISAVVALTGEVFSIKPVISIKNGEVKLGFIGTMAGNVGITTDTSKIVVNVTSVTKFTSNAYVNDQAGTTKLADDKISVSHGLSGVQTKNPLNVEGTSAIRGNMTIKTNASVAYNLVAVDSLVA